MGNLENEGQRQPNGAACQECFSKICVVQESTSAPVPEISHIPLCLLLYEEHILLRPKHVTVLYF